MPYRIVHGLNRNQIKYIAVFTMLLDHIAAFLLEGGTPLYGTMRFFGRLTAPVMCYFLAEGYLHTSSRKKYALRLLAFAVVSQIPFMLVNRMDLSAFSFNMLFTLLLCFGVLYVCEHVVSREERIGAVGTLVLLSLFGDWGIFAPLWTLVFWKYRNDRKRMLLYFSGIACLEVLMCAVTMIGEGRLWYQDWWQLGCFLFLPVCLCYNGKRGGGGSMSKWIFYLFYPVHLLVIWRLM